MFSIIIPVYNVEQYVSRCIDSIIAQDLDDWEVVLIDDGSSDGSGAVCDDYATKDSRIKVIHETNHGVSHARNTGIDNMTGDYVMFIDPDDWIGPELLSECKTAFDKGADIVGFDVFSVVSDGNKETIRKEHTWRDAGDRMVFGTDVYAAILMRSAKLSNKAIKSELLRGERLNEKMSFGEDCEYLVRILKKTKSVWLTNYGGYYYFINRNGNVVSGKMSDRDIEFLKNNYEIYNELSDCPDKTIRVHRINVAVLTIMIKLRDQKISSEEAKIYIFECRKLSRYPSVKAVLGYLADKKYPIKHKIRYVTFRITPRIWLRSQK